MEKFKIAKRNIAVTGNKRKADSLFLTLKSTSPEVTRTFELLWDRAKLLTPSVTFDPLNLFEKKRPDVSVSSNGNNMNNTEENDINTTEEKDMNMNTTEEKDMNMNTTEEKDMDTED